eukprot:6321696-Alexandrium_andersonii.AAC.1
MDVAAAAEDLADGRTEVVEEVAGRYAHCVDLTLFKGDEWFVHTGRGAVASIAGAGEEATLPLAAEGWLH